MTAFEHILNMDEQTFDRLISAGVIRSNARRDLEIYEYYAKDLDKFGSMQAMANAAYKFSISEDRIKAIVYKIRQLCTN